MEFKSDDCAGQHMTLTLCSSKNRLTFLDVCLESLSAWNIQSSDLLKFSSAKGIKFLSRVSTYWCWSIYTANWTRTVYSHSSPDHNRTPSSFNCQSYALQVKFLAYSSSYVSSSIQSKTVEFGFICKYTLDES